MDEELGIVKGTMTITHSYTGDQRLLDASHGDLRSARAAALNTEPTSTGAAKAVSLVLPQLKGKLNDIALRVPTPDVSVVDLVVNVEKKGITAEEVNAAFRKAADGPLAGVLAVCDVALVSVDFSCCDVSSTIDSSLTMVMGDDMVKVVAWYDNEWGYSQRVVDLAHLVAKKWPGAAAAGSGDPLEDFCKTSPGLMRAVNFESPGDPDVLFLREVPIPILEDDEILIKVVAVGVNREDIWRRKGGYPPLLTGAYLGYECSGIVIAIGSDVLSFKIGDKVCAILRYGGGYAELVAVNAKLAVLIPSGISLVGAAALPQATCLTIYCLDVLRKLSSDKTILIHGAAGGVGLIALQFAKHVGCDVFAVAGKPGKLQTCKMLGANVCINHTKEDFSKVVKDKTKGKGVDIILDLYGNEFFHKNLDCLAIGGSLIIIGVENGRIVELKISVLRKKAISILGANLQNLPLGEVKDLLHKAQEKFWPLIKDGHIKAVVGKSFTFSAAADAHRAVEKSDIAGKVLLVTEKSYHGR